MKVNLACVILIVSLTCPRISSADGNDPLRPLRTTKPPVIDGKIDDPVWKEAPFVTGFKTFVPDFGLDMVEKTEVYMAYDRENLYFAYRCFDSQPDKIKSSITARDNVRPDDWICLNLDSFNDHQSLYAFYVNPAGIQGDSRYSSGREDHSVDVVWYSAGQIDSLGYVVEMQIPLKSIRFSNKNPVEMSVFFERRISRRSEQGSYPAMSPEKGMAFLTQMKPMVYDDLKHYTLFELLPAVTYSYKKSAEEGRLATDENRGDISLTTKYGISSKMILDGTYNPDFSQVESDAGQVDINLRYDLYFPEKRPFFLEGSENFNVAATSTHHPIQSVVHTRTIIDPVAGLKLSGKIGRKNMLASIYAMDDLPENDAPAQGEYAHFAILRYKRALNQDAYIGGLYTGRELKNAFNRVGGTDGHLRLGESTTLRFYGFMSQTKDSADAPVQNGHAVTLNYRYETRDIGWGVEINDIAQHFRADAGYITRTGVTGYSADVSPKFYPKSNILRKINPQLLVYLWKDKPSNLWETYNFLSMDFTFMGRNTASVMYTYSTEVYLGERFKTNGLDISGLSQMTKQFYIQLSYRNGMAIYYSDTPYQGKGNNASATIIYQPSEKIRSEWNLTYSNFYRDSDSQKIYDYTIARWKLTYQMNKYLFFRGIVEYNDYYREMLTDFLASFTYIPGTVIHIGYGNLYEKVKWHQGQYINSDRFTEMRRGFFFKTSYLWRL